MAFSLTKLQTVILSGNQPTLTLPSYTIAANKLGLMVVGWRNSTNTDAPISVVHTGMTPTLVLKASLNSDSNLAIYRCMAGSPATSTTVFTWANNTYQAGASAVEIAGVDLSGTHGSGAVGGSGGTNVIAATGTSAAMTATLPNAFASVNNGTFGGLFCRNTTAEAAVTQGSGFTLLDDLVAGTYRQTANEWQTGNDSTVDFTLSESQVQWALVGLELVLAVEAASDIPNDLAHRMIHQVIMAR